MFSGLEIADLNGTSCRTNAQWDMDYHKKGLQTSSEHQEVLHLTSIQK
jgi:hypothetical protein